MHSPQPSSTPRPSAAPVPRAPRARAARPCHAPRAPGAPALLPRPARPSTRRARVPRRPLRPARLSALARLSAPLARAAQRPNARAPNCLRACSAPTCTPRTPSPAPCRRSSDCIAIQPCVSPSPGHNTPIVWRYSVCPLLCNTNSSLPATMSQYTPVYCDTLSQSSLPACNTNQCIAIHFQLIQVA